MGPLSNLAIVRASWTKRLWLAACGIAVFLATVWSAHALFPPPGPKEPGFGLDFIAFYTAGSFVREGRTSELYNLDSVHQFQRELAAKNHFEIGHSYGPWWNPPFYALVFSPLSRLPYPTASAIWIGINLACFAAALVLLCSWVPKQLSWKSRALVPVLVVLSAPFILAVSHAQNTCTSLLLLTLTVTLWRAAGSGDRSKSLAFFTGLVGGLLFYKPQVAALVAAMLVLDLGWRALAGYSVTGIALLVTNLIALPGTLDDYLHRLPVNVQSFQTGTVYPWEQHVTLKAFWRLLLQGHSLGDAAPLVVALTTTSALAVGLPLLRQAWLLRTSAVSEKIELSALRRDRLIAATIAAAPLLMPFYFDYDLLLLAVPAVLVAAEWAGRDRHRLDMTDHRLLTFAAALYCWQMINTDVGEKIHLNGAVALLACVATLLIARVHQMRAPSVNEAESPNRVLAGTARPITV
jgi:hypothetical protein